MTKPGFTWTTWPKKNHEIDNVKDEVTVLTKENQGLLEIKIVREMEIEACRKLLE